MNLTFYKKPPVTGAFLLDKAPLRIKEIGGGQMAKLEAKKQTVEEIAQNFKESDAAVVVDYRGLDVAEITALRKELRDNDITYKVYKNTLARRALEDVELTELSDLLVGPTAIAFGKEDVVAPAKILYGFAKDHDALEVKGGVIDGKVTPVEDLEELSKLPDYNGLVSMLLSVLQAPIRNLAYVTKAVAEEKEASGEGTEEAPAEEAAEESTEE